MVSSQAGHAIVACDSFVIEKAAGKIFLNIRCFSVFHKNLRISCGNKIACSPAFLYN